MRLFHWLCASEMPSACDLRRCGWELAQERNGGVTGVALAHRDSAKPAEWLRLLEEAAYTSRARTLLLGVASACERVRLLRIGFGEVLGALELAELDARAQRVARHAGLVEPRREIGPLTLDLLMRDGFVRDRRLGLHPREFALAWRLADQPGLPLHKQDLLRDVWRLGHVPETNSIAVHVSRLRAKLAVAGLHDAIRTVPRMGYALMTAPAIPMLTNDSPLADHTLHGTCGAAAEEAPHELRFSRE